MIRESQQKTGMSSKHLDLSVIDEAYGDYADLYSDVLRVSVAASPEQIQMAYFDRRSELFTLLAKLDARPDDEKTLQERLEAERKMDSVVLTVRVLGDPDQRSTYDSLRQKRLLNRRRAQQGQLPGHKPRVPAGFDASAAEVEEDERRREKREERRSRSSHASKSVKKSKKHKKRRDEGEEQHTVEEPPPIPSPPKTSSVSRKSTVATPDMIESFDEESLRHIDTKDTDEMKQDDGDTTVYTLTSVGDEKISYFSLFTHSKIMRRISDEISGACEDTLISVDQVFNAFTLTDKDIRAVTKRIDKAKRQLDA
jgi:curved DNA-binding protein CbpA